MADIFEQSLIKHKEWKGKITTQLKSPLETTHDLALAYSPGVAQPCREIAKDKRKVYDYTWKQTTVAVITDGTAVLGLGDIGPEAALPVMEGKCALFKSFGNVDAIPICLDTKDTQEIIAICKALAPSFGGFNLEDIAAPKCVEIERTLKRELDIPIFHDDQHGTAIVVIAGLINALKLVDKKPEDLKVVVSGVGAAGSSIIYMLRDFGVKRIYGFKRSGTINKQDKESYDFLAQELCEFVNPDNSRKTMAEELVGADVFIGVSVGNIVSQDMIASMNEKAIVFALANPDPEISYDDALKANAFVVGTGRSDFPNQVNNVLAFPGLFKGALACRAQAITEAMKMAAARGIASLIDEVDLRPDYVIPSPFDPKVADVVAQAVIDEATKSNISNKKD
jgi:malate dehydrogenase (oxaloacetate-decarboxylating)